jgi:pilus assembly protein CpaF
MVLMADLEMPVRVILQQLASAIKIVVQVARLSDGSRKMISICEVMGVKDDLIQLNQICEFKRTGVSDSGKVLGRFEWSGEAPRILERLRVSGIELPADTFQEVVEIA